jgi:hypothetical protein
MKEANQSSVGRMRKMFRAALMLVLLLPVPAFAALDFSNNKWTITSDNTTTGFFSLGPGTTNAAIDLQYAATNSSPFPNGSQVVITSQAINPLLPAITGATGDQIKDTITNLIVGGATGDIKHGQYTVSTSVTNVASPNQFTDGPFDSTTAATLPITHVFGGLTGNPVITVTFTFSDDSGGHAFQFNNGALSSTHSTMTFSQGP